MDIKIQKEIGILNMLHRIMQLRLEFSSFQIFCVVVIVLLWWKNAVITLKCEEANRFFKIKKLLFLTQNLIIREIHLRGFLNVSLEERLCHPVYKGAAWFRNLSSGARLPAFKSWLSHNNMQYVLAIDKTLKKLHTFELRH